jgi:hypothetical protein
MKKIIILIGLLLSVAVMAGPNTKFKIEEVYERDFVLDSGAATAGDSVFFSTPPIALLGDTVSFIMEILINDTLSVYTVAGAKATTNATKSLKGGNDLNDTNTTISAKFQAISPQGLADTTTWHTWVDWGANKGRTNKSRVIWGSNVKPGTLKSNQSLGRLWIYIQNHTSTHKRRIKFKVYRVAKWYLE